MSILKHKVYASTYHHQVALRKILKRVEGSGYKIRVRTSYDSETGSELLLRPMPNDDSRTR